MSADNNELPFFTDQQIAAMVGTGIPCDAAVTRTIQLSRARAELEHARIAFERRSAELAALLVDREPNKPDLMPVAVQMRDALTWAHRAIYYRGMDVRVIVDALNAANEFMGP